MGGFVADDIVRWVINNGLPPQETARSWQYWTRAAKWMNKASDDESINKLKRIWQYNRLGVKDLFLDEAEILLFPEDYPELKRSPPLKENVPSSRPIRPASADDARTSMLEGGLASSRASSDIGTPTREPSHTPEIISIKTEPPEPPDDQSESNFSVSTTEHG